MGNARTQSRLFEAPVPDDAPQGQTEDAGSTPSRPDPPPPHLSDKELGSYYTDLQIAQFLARWAVRTGRETVLDPSFGGGVFLTAATAPIEELGGDPAAQIYGVELDECAFETFVRTNDSAISSQNLRRADFFELDAGCLPRIDVVVGNPPFIRYQRFAGRQRQIALSRARQAGVQIPRLASSWAPFLVRSADLVAPGGRLAMVVPMELAHAAYAQPVLRYLAGAFARIQILTFAKRLFPNLSEATVLLLAEGRGQAPEGITLHDLPSIEALAMPPAVLLAERSGTLVDGSVVAGQERLLQYVLPERARRLYRELRRRADVAQLGRLADVGIGYVTGDNSFFHLDRETAEQYRLPPELLRRAMRTSADLSGLTFTSDDWERLAGSGSANQLLSIPPGASLAGQLVMYLETGKARDVPLRYKCRVRRPWYSVPHVYVGDCFLTYMSGMRPRLVANEAGTVSPNVLHVLRLRDLQTPVTARSLAVLWLTSLTGLSCELEGHSLGGGMLKLEPTEAERVAVALPAIPSHKLEALALELDALVRTGRDEEAQERADTLILGIGLGLSTEEIEVLRSSAQMLRERRIHA